jgi:hypothetical protein
MIPGVSIANEADALSDVRCTQKKNQTAFPQDF